MYEFKIGDKIVALSNLSHNIRKNKIYTIQEIGASGNTVLLKEEPVWFWVNTNFKLYKHKKRSTMI